MPQSEMIALFSTPLYKTKVEIDDNINEDFLKTIEYNPYPNQSGWCSADGKILLDERFKSVKAEVDKHVEIFLYEIIKLAQGRPKHTQSWINKTGPNGYSEKHYHTNAFISGGIYLECPPNCGGIVFNQSHTSPTWSANSIRPALKELTVFNADNWAFEVNRGDLFLFPSHLMHQVENNMSGKDRYMIAFNYFLEGDIGEHTGAMQLRVS
tara:strand:- start:1005 stop:1634 length:630 start_codon:yes stop_codon:yes gene_type:complete